MKLLQTPDERFASLPDDPFAPHFAEISDLEGGSHFLREAIPDAWLGPFMPGLEVTRIAPLEKQRGGLGTTGFPMRDYLHRVPEALQALSKWTNEGRLTTREHILEGIECFASAVKMLFAGEKRGRLRISV